MGYKRVPRATLEAVRMARGLLGALKGGPTRKPIDDSRRGFNATEPPPIARMSDPPPQDLEHLERRKAEQIEVEAGDLERWILELEQDKLEFPKGGEARRQLDVRINHIRSRLRTMKESEGQESGR
jgi:hypothetical protein